MRQPALAARSWHPSSRSTIKSITNTKLSPIEAEGSVAVALFASLASEEFASEVKLNRVDIAEDLWNDVGKYSFKHAEGDICPPKELSPLSCPSAEKSTK